MRDAMAKLKQQSGDIALKAQKEATLAYDARVKAQGELGVIQSELESARAEIEAAKTESLGLKSSLAASESKARTLECHMNPTTFDPPDLRQCPSSRICRPDELRTRG